VGVSSVYTGQCGEPVALGGWRSTGRSSILFSFEADFAGG
jgi:hypothetical protein